MSVDETNGAHECVVTGQSRYLTVQFAGQTFGLPVESVRDVLGPQRIVRIPLAPPEIAGALNLRGRIVTAIDPRVRLGLPPGEDRENAMSVVVERDSELYSILVDGVGDVLGLDEGTYERHPPTLDPVWRDVLSGIHRLEGMLLLALDVDRLLAVGRADLAVAV